MKTSNKILLITLIVIVVFITGMIITTRIILYSANDKASAFYDKEFVPQKFSYEDFNSLKVYGHWSIDIEQGDDYSVILYYPEELSDRISVEHCSKELIIDSNIKWYSRRRIFRAEIIMPLLKSIEIVEGSSISFEDFSCDYLNIKTTGAAEIKGRNSSINDLDMVCDGASHVNLRHSQIVNATLHLSGASRVELTMNGGKLSGTAHGASSIVYYGEVAKQDIETAGAVSIRHR
ncbi:MAG: DUF2807 domain-containing protein [Candidatus Marinimicrobia bacterium]|nr:DUF2807 domain-containing protein [Candidatus Neomarinimicrobiota bacterium]